MAIEVTSGNTTLLQSQVASLLVQPLTQASTFLAAGPQIFDTSDQLRIPRIASGVTAGFVGEGAQISDGDMSFDEVTLLPSTLKSLKVLVRFSNEMARQSVIALDATLKSTLVTNVAEALDAALWDGAGTSNTIKGIFKQSGIATGTLDLTDADSLIDGLATAQGNKVTPSHWVMTAASFAALRKLKVGTTDARYIFDPSTIQNGTSFQLLGLPVIITDNLPNAAGTPTKARVGLVDFSKVAVARDLDAEVKVLDQTWGDFDSVGIRVVTRYDVGLLQPKAVTVLTEA
ncbi:phage major capsid protein, HK97 [Mycobacteroides abscessus subsp. abscessus]|uniref:Phage major capsid protein, HK97 n=1 Tax=Mycobacteroides abscessus TaxID=36809 RepID=A0AB33T089_9MYCO|nr:phage major capsid protein [Mycobacteroides abscessus]MDO3015310.1 phage major capsid protein [Mycobacteroides abscessus subsp. abscessus]MDO3085863.1 phage major capsid protein [Mycobacteroides abscessus subsp. abscessus]MDO3315766.1 phage major capsid protein [Mycobacteroides abscessus subsp. abscessus]MDO3343053.1 phage major capsid protein [Mycobacteroides abscessus subsp. abscessus]PVB17163.1 phage major capsid protein [Mycobacteroides abscessus]